MPGRGGAFCFLSSKNKNPFNHIVLWWGLTLQKDRFQRLTTQKQTMSVHYIYLRPFLRVCKCIHYVAPSKIPTLE